LQNYNINFTIFSVVDKKNIDEIFDLVNDMYNAYSSLSKVALICLTDPVPTKEISEQFMNTDDFIKLCDIVYLLHSTGYPVIIHGKFQKLYNLVVKEKYKQLNESFKLEDVEEVFINADRTISTYHSKKSFTTISDDKTLISCINDFKNEELIKNNCSGCINIPLCSSYNIDIPLQHNGLKFCKGVIESL